MQLDMARITHAVPLSVAFGSDPRLFPCLHWQTVTQDGRKSSSQSALVNRVPAGLYAGCEYNSCWHNRSEVIEAIKICAKTNASLGLSYDPWSSFWTSDPTVRGKQQACCEQHTSLSLNKLV